MKKALFLCVLPCVLLLSGHEKTAVFRRFLTGDERIELPLRVLETPVIPFDQSPLFLSRYKRNTFRLPFASGVISLCTFKTTYKKKSIRSFLSTIPWLCPRPISNSQLHALLHFHLCPIYLVVFKGSYCFPHGISHLEGGFTLRCLQRLSRPGLATLPCTW